MTERSEFADKLMKALTDSGFKYFGKLVLSDEEFNSYKDLSPRAMAERYSKAHDLAKKNAILTVLQLIYTNNKANKFTFAVRDKLEAVGLHYMGYLFMFRNEKNGMILVDGHRAASTYTWLPDRPPTFSDAEYYLTLFNKIRQYRFDIKPRKVFDENWELPSSEILKLLNITDPVEKLCAEYRIMTLQKQNKAVEVSKQKQLKSKNEKKDKIVTSSEVRHTTVYDERHNFHMKQPEIPIEENGIDTDPDEFSCDKEVEGTLFILHKKLKLYQKIIKQEQKYSKRLEKEILRLKKKS